MLSAELGISSAEAIHLMVLLETPINLQGLAVRDGEYVKDLIFGELFEFLCRSVDLPDTVRSAAGGG